MGPIEAQFMQMLANGSEVAAPAWILGAVVVLAATLAGWYGLRDD